MKKLNFITNIGTKWLVGVMLVALLALLGIQWYWVTNAVELKEEQFERKVNDALTLVAERLQDHETYRHITSAFPLMPGMKAGPQQTDFDWTQKLELDTFPGERSIRMVQRHTVTNGKHEKHVEVMVVAGGKDSLLEFIEKETPLRKTQQTDEKDGRKHEFQEEHVIINNRDGQAGRKAIVDLDIHGGQAYIQTAIERLLQGSRPIEQRIDRKTLDKLIRRQLAREGIEESYSFEIIKHPNAGFTLAGNRFVTRDKEPEIPGKFAVELFPHDLRPTNTYLQLEFPKRANATIQAMGLLLPTSGVLVLVVVLCFGLTLYALQRQKKLSEMKTDFINNMTHELKTPISTISLAVQALADPDMQRSGGLGHFTNIIREENDRLQTHVERVLQAAAFDRSQFSLRHVEIDLSALLAHEVSRIADRVQKRDGTVEVEHASGTLHLQADEVHLSGILFNLLDNAVKYSPVAPVIHVRTETIEDGAAISVSDQGIGMSRDAQKRVFDKFYRVSTGNLHDVKGFGLGLSYVRTMVEAHGGSIEVWSEPGKGSTFRIWLPAKAPVQT